MPNTTLVSTTQLAQHLEDEGWAIMDCRFSLDDPHRGRRDYQLAHIPGAVFADLETDLSGPIVAGVTGRHPLPDVEAFVERLSHWGIGPGVQVVAYDDANGSMAARLWWMLRWMGHDDVAVLDGGWARWQAEGRPERAGNETRNRAAFVARPRPELVATTTEVESLLGGTGTRLVDSRSPERYGGAHEPIDPVAGHIPGAICAPFAENLGAEGRFRPPAELRARFMQLLGDASPEQTIFYCGSGVSAAHNILALTHAGLGNARLYAGSWSEWIVDPERPIVTGGEPG